MGIQYSTTNYEKIINLLDPPYLESLNFLNNSLVEAINIDNDKRFLVYRHKTKNIFLFYSGNLCAITNCFDISEQLLLINSKQFGDFYKMKEYIIKNFPRQEIISEIIKYETSHDLSILNCLELGTLPMEFTRIDIEFTDSEDDDYSDDFEVSSPEKDESYIFPPTKNINVDIYDNYNDNQASVEVENDIKDALNEFESFFDNKFSKDINTDWALEWNREPFNNSESLFDYSNNINKMPVINEVPIINEVPVINAVPIINEVPVINRVSTTSKENVFKFDDTETEESSETESKDEYSSETDEDENKKVFLENDTVKDEESKEYTSIFEKIIPNFNYFNFFN